MSNSIKTSDLAEHWNPLESDVWGFGKPVTRRRVQSRIDAGNLLPYETRICRNQYDHAARVAFLVVNPASEPIEIEISEYAGVVVGDGNHRLAAAIFRGDKTIEVNFGGFIDIAEEFFGVLISSDDDENVILTTSL